jgi:uncharacterized protein (DUF433 family)
MRSPEDYFERDDDGIRLKGHRMWLEDILELHAMGLSPRQIIGEQHFPTLSLEEVEAAIAYYSVHKDEVDVYLEQQRAEAKAREELAESHPSAVARHLRRILEERKRDRAPLA